MRVSLMFTAFTLGRVEVVELAGFDELELLGRDVVELRLLLDLSLPEHAATASPVITRTASDGTWRRRIPAPYRPGPFLRGRVR